jgi:threonyl-tRNA synthetase
MKALFFHCKRYGVRVGKLSNRPKNILPEVIKHKNQKCKDCVVVFLTVEKDDNPKTCSALVLDLKKMLKEIGQKNIVLLPFAHLSSNLADSETVIRTLDIIEEKLRPLKISRGHFGSHKSLLLEVYGHPGNARFREF